MREFHISKTARDLYEVEDTLFALRGNVVFANYNAARILAQKINSQRDLVSYPDQAAHASHLNALGIMDEIFHIMVNEYRQRVNPDVFEKALIRLDEVLGRREVDSVLTQFAVQFPTTPVYRNQIQPQEYYLSETDGIPNRQIILEELLMLWLDNENPAAINYRELFDHDDLIQNTSYLPLLNELYDFFQAEPGLGENGVNLIDLLREPALESPDSLEGQLEFINRQWGKTIRQLIERLLPALDFIHEETKPVFADGGPGPAQVLEFHIQEYEPENFSPDLDWMPHLILIAKNTYVWLDQLSKKHEKPIQRLDEIPDEELLTLAKWGFTGLWLIGLWERSPASQRIKQMRGNPEAVASAYSLYDYQIANDIGGEEAYRILRDRAWQYGIRLSADMVPNHMGIDSRWVIEHPDWFISLDYSPFPTYQFSGPNLSSDDRVGIFLEDHYYDNSDAAVVFKRVDHWTGSEKFFYHGNDGTSMPWNDTAQLNYLLPEVREAVIQTILEVARKFPIIRFDAAMTLSKKHYQRLWFPEPGTGGDIPSRAEFGLSREQFDTAIPIEFWREVVDRVAQEVPDTLLLAEAFWLMEGYFVRTLGMHRVYNSAFMNMLRDEKNAQYRLVIKNTLEFDPEILKRYVNFMNNPDERTTIDQFGAGDKYFGICVLLSTLPGLPMFGHGQIEGFSEKYGMEYQKAYWDEPVNMDLVLRHEKEIFPILRRRRQFAEVEDFLLYDFYLQDGTVNENVYAFSNLIDGERSLVIYNNFFGDTSGWIKSSVAYAVKSSANEADKELIQREITHGLDLGQKPNEFIIFRDQISGLEYLRNCREILEHGLKFELKAYQYHIFLDFRQITDTELHIYAQLAAHLQGSGVPEMEEALKELILQSLLDPFRDLLNPAIFRSIASAQKLTGDPYLSFMEEIDVKMKNWLSEVQILSEGTQDLSIPAAETQTLLKIILRLAVLNQTWIADTTTAKEALAHIGLEEESSILGSYLAKGNHRVWGLLLSWLFIHPIGLCSKKSRSEADEISRIWLDDWLLSKIVRETMIELGMDGYSSGRAIDMLRILVLHHGWWRNISPKRKIRPDEVRETALSWINIWLKDKSVQLYIGMNQFEDKVWFNKEAFEEFIWWVYLVSVIEIIASNPSELPPGPLPAPIQTRIINCYSIVKAILAAEAQSEFQTAKLVSYFTDG